MSSQTLSLPKWISSASFSALGILSVTSAIYLSLTVCHFLNAPHHLSFWDECLIPVAWLSSLLSTAYFYRAWESASEGVSIQERAELVQKQIKRALFSGVPFFWAVALLGYWFIAYSLFMHA